MVCLKEDASLALENRKTGAEDEVWGGNEPKKTQLRVNLYIQDKSAGLQCVSMCARALCVHEGIHVTASLLFSMCVLVDSTCLYTIFVC